jgi:hypothetical protein
MVPCLPKAQMTSSETSRTFQRLADELEVLLGGLPSRLHGLAPAGGEEDAVEVTGSQPGDPLGQLGLHGRGVAPHREERQLGRLLGGDLGQVAPAVADLHDEQPGEAVEDLPAAVVPDVGALAARDDGDRRLRVAALPCEVHPEVVGGPARRHVGGTGRVLLDGSRHTSSVRPDARAPHWQPVSYRPTLLTE